MDLAVFERALFRMMIRFWCIGKIFPFISMFVVYIYVCVLWMRVNKALIYFVDEDINDIF